MKAAWNRFLSPDHRGGEDRQFLAEQLKNWCLGQGLEAAALYGMNRGQEYGLKASLGAGSFPPYLAARRFEAAAQPWEVLTLPQALLLYPQSAEVAVDDPALLLLAAGARISGLKQELQEQSFQAKFRGVELEALYDVGLAIASTLDLEELCDEALLRAVSLLDARRGALYLLEDGHYRLTSRFGGEALVRFGVSELDLETLVEGELQGPTDWLPGVEHLLVVPVEIEGDARGLLVVADKESRRGVGPFPSTDRRTLELFANQAAIALENAKLHKVALEKERLEREMELAAEIQQQLLPKTVATIPGFEVLGWNRPARQVGGDYFDIQRLDKGRRWGLVVGDVTGKGMPAALLVSTLHSALRVLGDRMEVGPPLIELLNRHIYEFSSANKFITLLLAVLDLQTSTLTFLNAGHNPGLLLRADGSVELLNSSGLPLGLMPLATYSAEEFKIEADDLVCLYSDGITECESPEEEEFGLERLIDLLQAHRDRPLVDIIGEIDRVVTGFAENLPQGDDQTVLLLRRTEFIEEA
jgi:sigma-B regulation protein RsbU (phosphoserine phosphatase)